MADIASTPVSLFKKRAPKAIARKRLAAPLPASDSGSDLSSSEDETGRRVKRQKRSTGISAASNHVKEQSQELLEPLHIATTSQLSESDNDATKRSNWYDDEHDKFHTKASGPDVVNDGTYKGSASYRSFIEKNPDRVSNIGPQKLNSNVRTITVTDFAPDVCKDYKQTGFCGFGDSCKFLHAREDYKQGWQLDRDWEIGDKGKKLNSRTVKKAPTDETNGSEDVDDEKLLESIPFKCIICKDDYKNPVITKCGHYFCESCALKRYRKDPNCANCGQGTGGVFNVAKKLNKLLDRKREREVAKADVAANG